MGKPELTANSVAFPSPLVEAGVVNLTTHVAWRPASVG